MSLSFVTKRGFAVVGADATGLRTKVARLTPKGRKAQEACRQLLIAIELRWQKRLDKETIGDLRESLAGRRAQGTIVASVSRAGDPPRRVASVTTQARHAVAFSHGPAPGRIP